MPSKVLLFIFLFAITGYSLFGQEVRNVDSAFFKARQLAYSGKYDSAKVLCQKILLKSPQYADVKVLLGRIYFWLNKTDSSIGQLDSVIANEPYEDAFIALSDIERWSDNYQAALDYANEGLISYSTSEDLQLRKARALYALKRNKEANTLLDSMLVHDRKNNEARQLSERIKLDLSANLISLSYDYDHFDKEFSNDWHLLSLAYTRVTKTLGSVTARINWADRFNSTGEQYEADLYPSLGKKMYAYVSAAYSPLSIFPKYYVGLSVYRSLPKAFEAELGLRWLYFSQSTVLYTGSIGKYYKNFWFSLRPTVISYSNGTRFSQSYSFTTRLYTKSTNDYYTFKIGYGLSPDDYSLEALLANPFSHTFSIHVGYQTVFKYKNIFSVGAGLLNEGFYRGNELKYGNDYSINLGYQRYF